LNTAAKPPLRVVGVGASAGGLEALRALVAVLPAGLHAAYVVAQHLSPTHRSMLSELLGRETGLQVVEINEGMEPQADTVHITPASCHVRLLDGHFKLEPATRAGTPKPSVDALFESLAASLQHFAIGVVLSGTGSDGARGVRAIHAAGGYTLAQDPAQAKYDGMPRAAIESGCVDFICEAAAMGDRLAQLLALQPGMRRPDSDTESPTHLPAMDRIVHIVKRRTGFDLALYKARSLERRIHRRMVATESASLDVFAQRLQASPEEAQRLVREMFISVTAFFRDTEAFKQLDSELGRLLDNKPADEELRLWVPGCATGEEAYSIAMLIAEHLDRLQRWPSVRLFASDLDDKALAIARRGSYAAAALEEIPTALAAKYLSADAGSFSVNKRLRDMVIFSEHNLLRDPPFLRLDMVSCRNLMIYFQPDVQQRLFNTFAHALKSGGLLFVGKAEALHSRTELFAEIGAAGNLYRATGAHQVLRASGSVRNRLAPMRAGGELVASPANSGKPWDLGQWLTQAHVEGLLPPFVLVDDQGRLQHVFGDVSPYLRLAGGGASLDITRLAVAALQLELRATLLKCQREPGQRVYTDVHLPAADSSSGSPGSPGVQLRLIAQRRESAGVMALTLVLFSATEPGAATPSAGAAPLFDADQRQLLEEQLQSTRRHLSTVVNELESVNEELQSMNEELHSSNEEMQSTNEELETANEELQSTNEELITVNEELESRSAELALRNTDLHNVKNSLVDPLIVLDRHRRVTLFNPPATLLFGLEPASLGTLLYSLPSKLEMAPAAAALKQVIADGVMRECDVTGDVQGERHYRLRMQPYLNSRGQSEGAVLCFQDVTVAHLNTQALAAAHEQTEAAQRFADATIDALSKFVGVVDAEGLLVSANRSWRQAQAGPLGVGLCALGQSLLQTIEMAAMRGSLLPVDTPARLRDVLQLTTAELQVELQLPGPEATHHLALAVTPFDATAHNSYWVVSLQDISQRKAHEAHIALQAQVLDSALEAISIADATRPDLPLMYVNRTFENLTGYTAAEVLGQNCRFLQGQDRQQHALVALRKAITNRTACRVLLRNYRKDGSMFWNELTLNNLTDGDKVTHVVALQRDVTAMLASEQSLKASLERESQALAFAGLGSLEWDIRGAVITLSERHASLLGLTSQLTHMPVADFRRLVHGEDLPLIDEAIKLCVAGHAGLDLEYRVTWPDGTVHWLHTRGNSVVDAQNVCTRVLALSQDVSDRRDAESKVRFIAHHDTLTGLPNRALLRDRFQLALNGARRNTTRLAVVFVDLDRFKEVNDSLGHEVGDALLVSVADRMRTAVRDTDTVCRQSGDEFVVLLPNVRDANDAEHLADKLVRQIAKPHQLGKHEITLTCSAGVAMYPDDGNTMDEVLRHADGAMYHAKNRGRNQVAFFSSEMNRHQHDRKLLVDALRGAVARFQPQLSVVSGELVGMEALLRWQHPERGLLMPDMFIGAAEESELIVPIGDWVLRQACEQAARWRAAGYPHVPMAVNVSPLQLRQSDFLSTVQRTLAELDLPGGSLQLEITERALILKAEPLEALLHQLRALGVGLALDDFGTGYSSLTHLQRFPVDTLKIDRSFIHATPGDASAWAIARAVINMALSLNLAVVAEGVETAEQLALLQQERCTGYQGFITAPAMATAEFEAWFDAQNVLHKAAASAPAESTPKPKPKPKRQRREAQAS
jgi:two-component system, chemotaxis family, CheB/CheR fusion protein